jgi:hypothetical protein
LASAVLLAGMPYSTQLYLVTPSTATVVINTANSLVPAGAFAQLSAKVEPGPSQVYSAGSAPPSAATALLSVKAVADTVVAAVTAGVVLPVAVVLPIGVVVDAVAAGTLTTGVEVVAVLAGAGLLVAATSVLPPPPQAVSSVDAAKAAERRFTSFILKLQIRPSIQLTHSSNSHSYSMGVSLRCVQRLKMTSSSPIGIAPHTAQCPKARHI